MGESAPLSADGELTEYEYELLSRPLPDGLIGHPDDDPPVTFTGGTVTVREGLLGNLLGYPWQTTTGGTAYTPSLAGADRTDLVVLRLDRPGGHVVGSAYLTGTPGAGAPAVTQDESSGGVYEIPLTDVNISGGAITSLKRRCWYVGSDGQILADSDSTMPPHSAGRIVTRTDTKKTLISTGTAPWRVLADSSGQLPITLVSGWTFSANYLRRINGHAEAQLSVQRTGNALGVSRVKVAVLDGSCVPDRRFETVAYVTGASDGSGGYPTFAEVRTDGTVWVDLYRGVAKSKYVVVAKTSFGLA